MKKLLQLFLSLMTLWSCNTWGNTVSESENSSFSSEKTETNIRSQEINLPIFYVDEPNFDFGLAKSGDKILHNFVVTNLGKSPLIIDKATGSCGCTATEFPKKIEPGQSKEIKAVFDSSNKIGFQRKTITLDTNTKENLIVLTLTGIIKK